MTIKQMHARLTQLLEMHPLMADMEMAITISTKVPDARKRSGTREEIAYAVPHLVGFPGIQFTRNMETKSYVELISSSVTSDQLATGDTK